MTLSELVSRADLEKLGLGKYFRYFEALPELMAGTFII